MLTVQQAEYEMAEAEKLTPGAWAPHSRSAGTNARIIAEHCGLDGDRAYVFGLLHDIGRRKGSWDGRHIIDGYEYMTEIGQPEIARICLTHTFPVKSEAARYALKMKISDAQKRFICEYMDGIEYDDYDRLIQLCDAISLPSGAVIMEKRLMDVALRHGVGEYSVEKWKSFFALKALFDKKCGCNIYALLPNIAENSLADL